METLTPRPSGPVQLRLAWLDTTRAPDGFDTLDADEQARAGRFAFERDRRRFVGRRAFLRQVLGDVTGAAPADIRYGRSATGKPHLEDASGIAFSTSHAGGLAIVAVGAKGEVGVDIERIRPMPDALDIAERFFTAGELEHVRAAAPAERSEAFLSLWTRKEAYVKLLGRGLAIPLDSFDALGELPCARLWPVDVPDGYVASVAVAATARAAAPTTEPATPS